MDSWCFREGAVWWEALTWVSRTGLGVLHEQRKVYGNMHMKGFLAQMQRIAGVNGRMRECSDALIRVVTPDFRSLGRGLGAGFLCADKRTEYGKIP